MLPINTALVLVLAATPSFALAAANGVPAIGTATPALETQTIPDNASEADADDPAVWVARGDRAGSLVVTAVKNGGIRVYDLKGRLVQIVDPAPEAASTISTSPMG